MAQLWPTRDLENVDPATGLLSTLNSIGPAAGGKKGVAVAKGTPFADLTSLFGGQVSFAWSLCPCIVCAAINTVALWALLRSLWRTTRLTAAACWPVSDRYALVAWS